MNYCINEAVLGHDLKFLTNDKCFSPKRIDVGTLAMLSAAELKPGYKALDLGCGYGVVGIACAMVLGQDNTVMVDIDEDAVRLARENASLNGVSDILIVRSDGFDSLDVTGFDIILCNPPYHTDFSVARRFIEKGFNRLNIGGKMLMVAKRREWYKRKLIRIFGGVKITQIDGYYVFEAVKTTGQYAYKPKKA